MQHWSQVPRHLQFNRYILQHYRPATGWMGCIRSLFYLHNETVNILSHVMPLVLIPICFDILLPWDEIDNAGVMLFLHILAITAPWIGSICYHLFMSHHGGQSVYDVLLALDMIGIWIAQTTGTIFSLWVTTSCLTLPVNIVLWLIFVPLSAITLKSAIVASSPTHRGLSFVIPFLFRILSITLRMMGFGGGSLDVIKHMMLNDLTAILGVTIGALRIPERWAPGYFDLVGHSHQILHLMVLFAGYHGHTSMTLDLLWMSQFNRGESNCYV